ncbi:MAG: AAA family ATPase, partial [Polyangiaceae bacterium]
MSNSEQLSLFNLSTRDDGHDKVSSSSVGLRQLTLERFKAFREFDVSFDQTTLLVGANSSGKTTVLQAIRLFFWCISVCGRKEGS